MLDDVGADDGAVVPSDKHDGPGGGVVDGVAYPSAVSCRNGPG